MLNIYIQHSSFQERIQNSGKYLEGVFSEGVFSENS